MTLNICHMCSGTIEPVARPGRTYEYRGVTCDVPGDLAIPTCSMCGREWVTSKEIAVLSVELERQRLALEEHRKIIAEGVYSASLRPTTKIRQAQPADSRVVTVGRLLGTAVNAIKKSFDVVVDEPSRALDADVRRARA